LHDVIARLFTRLRRRDGQSLILVAIAVPLMVLFLAFVVDTAHAFVDQRHLQNTADAASLAAAQQLTPGAPSCRSGITVGACATDYVDLNGGPALPVSGLPVCADAGGNPIRAHISSDPTATPNCYQWPYYDSNGVSHTDTVEVWLHQCTPTLVGGIVGVNRICESVSSLSSSTPQTTTISHPGSTSYSTSTSTTVITGTTVPDTTLYSTTVRGSEGGAVFAADSTCAGGVTITSSLSDFNFGDSGIWSNGGFHNKFAYPFPGPGSYGESCTTPIGTFGGGLTTNPGDIMYPSSAFDTNYPSSWDTTLNGSICGQAGAHIIPVDMTPYQIPSGAANNGIYCSEGEIDVTSTGEAQSLTIVAPVVNLDGSNDLSPFTQGLLAAATSRFVDPALTVSTDDQHISGDLWAPNSTAVISGNSLTSGFVEAKDVTISTDTFTLQGDGPIQVQGATTTSTPTSTITGTTQADSTSTSLTTSTSITPPSTSTATTNTIIGLTG
jgi:Putative Flp pilus-assembly TadE/G-like